MLPSHPLTPNDLVWVTADMYRGRATAQNARGKYSTCLNSAAFRLVPRFPGPWERAEKRLGSLCTSAAHQRTDARRLRLGVQAIFDVHLAGKVIDHL